MATHSEEAHALAEYMGNISQDAFDACWHTGIEYALWSACDEGRRRLGNVEITDEQVHTLKDLSDACGGWIVWDDEQGGETWIPLAKWRDRFAAHEAGERIHAQLRRQLPAHVSLPPEWQERLLKAVLDWRGQGAASKWTTGPSVQLVNTIDALRREYRELCDRIVPPPRVTGDCEQPICNLEAKVRLEDGTKLCQQHAISALVIGIDDAAQVQMAIRNAKPLWSTRVLDEAREPPLCQDCETPMAHVAGPGPKSGWTCVRCNPGPEDRTAPGPFDRVAHDWQPGDPDAAEQDWIFTFGSGHHRNGESLGKRFVRIHGTARSARIEMVRVFGFAWSHQYRTEEGAGVEQFGLTELELPTPPTGQMPLSEGEHEAIEQELGRDG